MATWIPKKSGILIYWNDQPNNKYNLTSEEARVSYQKRNSEVSFDPPASKTGQENMAMDKSE